MASRVDILKRRSHGERLAASVKERLSASLGRQVAEFEFLPLEQSDDLYRHFEQRWEQSRNAQYPGQRFFLETREGGDVQELSERVRTCFGEEPMYLFVPEARYCGAVRLSASDLLTNVLTLAVLDQDDVLACNSTGDKGMACEHFTGWGTSGSQAMYRFLAWC